MPEGARGTILVVDDDRLTLSMLQMILAERGHRVEVARGGKKALEAVKRLKPSLVLLDIGMPGMDGYEVARELRTLYGDRLPIIALTGRRQADMEQDTEKLFSEWLEKPFDVDTLSAAVLSFVPKET